MLLEGGHFDPLVFSKKCLLKEGFFQTNKTLNQINFYWQITFENLKLLE